MSAFHQPVLRVHRSHSGCELLAEGSGHIRAADTESYSSTLLKMPWVKSSSDISRAIDLIFFILLKSIFCSSLTNKDTMSLG